LEAEPVAELLDALYRKEWSLFGNLFCPAHEAPARPKVKAAAKGASTTSGPHLWRLWKPARKPTQSKSHVWNNSWPGSIHWAWRKKSSKSCARFCANKSAPHCTKAA